MNCNDCIYSDVCHYKAFNDQRDMKKRRKDDDYDLFRFDFIQGKKPYVLGIRVVWNVKRCFL